MESKILEGGGSRFCSILVFHVRDILPSRLFWTFMGC